jgi:alkylmercury lyase
VLATLAESLVGTLPACENAPLALTLVRELAEGEPVDASALLGDGSAALARWPNVEYDDDGRVVAFSGLSLTPTAHRFTVARRQLYTWCAWDALFLPAMLGRTADVRSRCPITGADVRLSVEPDGVRGAEPAALRVSFPPARTTSTSDITGSFCCHVHFLAGPQAGEQWLRQHPGGSVLALDDAYELGRIATRC